MKTNKGKHWIVRMKCVVIKDVYCDDCTEQQAQSNPFAFSTDEREIEQHDWEVIRVEENV